MINNKYNNRSLDSVIHTLAHKFVQTLILALVLIFLSGIAAVTASAADTPQSANTPTTQAATDNAAPEAAPDAFAAAIELLKANGFSEKEQAIAQLESLNDARSLKLFKYFLQGDLYLRKEDNLVVYADKQDDNTAITDVITQQSLGTIDSSDIKKIIVNNKLRKLLKSAIAQLNLNSPVTNIRLAALQEMLGSMDSEVADLLRNAITTETDSTIKDTMATAIALVDINSSNKAVRLQAITQLGGSLENEAFNKLNTLVQKDSEDKYLEPDIDVVNAANKALTSIRDKRALYGLIETFFFGVSLGSVLLLAAIGLAITFGVMGVINMAHGELIMLGAYTTYMIQLIMPSYIEYSLFVAIPAAFLVSGLFGIAIERGVIRFLYGRPLETLLATFGISLILQQLVRTSISAQNVPVETPQWMSGAMEINSVFSLTYNRFYIIIFSLIVFFALLAVLKKTSLGLQVRAVSQNRAMAKAMGIRTEWVDALTFGLGSGIAGVAGVALSQLTNVGPNLGQSYIIDSFMVVVFGGVGNLWGTLVGAMSLGVVNKFLEPWAGAVMAKILVLIFIILFIQKKPRGLFPQKGRAAEN